MLPGHRHRHLSREALLCDEHGGIIAARRGVSAARARPGWSEQEPEDWWVATAGAIRELLKTPGVGPRRSRRLSFSGQMHGSVLLGKDAAASKESSSLPCGGRCCGMTRGRRRSARRLSGRRGKAGGWWRWWGTPRHGRVYAAQALVGAGEWAGDLERGAARDAAQGLCAVSADGGDRDGCRRCGRHAAV